MNNIPNASAPMASLTRPMTTAMAAAIATEIPEETDIDKIIFAFSDETLQQTKIKSKHDFIAEVILTTRNGWTAELCNVLDKDCPICFGTVQYQYTLKTRCGHTYHRNCILANMLDYERYICPKCDAAIN